MRSKPQSLKFILSIALIILFIIASAVAPFSPFWYGRIKHTLVAIFSGGSIALAGAIFQTVFKNPIASPNILGVSTGVSLGNIIFIIMFGSYMVMPTEYRYVLCYGLSALLVGVTVFAGRLVNKKEKTFSVESMIIVGMIISNLGRVFMQYYQIQLDADDTGLAEKLATISNGDIILVDKVSMIAFFSVILISILPIILIRYRFNMVAFDDDDVKTMGISNTRLRLIGLICGSFMAAASIIHCGSIGFLALVVPFMCRGKLHVDFRDIALESFLIGGILSLLSKWIYQYTIAFGFLMPASVVLDLIILPLFVISIIRREGAFS